MATPRRILRSSTESKRSSLKERAEQTERLDPITEKAIDQVAKEIHHPDSKLNLFDLDFPEQNAFISDPAKRKALWCTRRAAKSFTAGLYLTDTAERFRECNVLYVGLTKDTAMGIIWKDILLKIDRKNELGIHYVESKRKGTTQNGSEILITGVDADEEEMQKLLGKKYKLIIIDEAQSYSVDLQMLVYGILGPTTIDENGTICLMGTAGNLRKGLFYDVTQGKEAGWKLFQWTAHQNPYVRRQWQEELDEIDRNRPLFKATAIFRQWYLNEWVVDDDVKVYKFSKAANSAIALPSGISGWRYVLGLDLAHSPDSTAFVVGCYHPSHPTLYIVKAFKEQKLDITGVAIKIKALEETYNFDVKVVDGANKQAVAELNNRHNAGLISADKVGKEDFIKLMNDDFIQRHIVLLPSAEPLATEYGDLIWITDSNNKVKEPKKENPQLPNDLTDAALYLWRHCYQYLYQKPKSEERTPEQKMSDWEKSHIAKLEEQVKAEQNPDPTAPLDWDPAWENPDDDLP